MSQGARTFYNTNGYETGGTIAGAGSVLLQISGFSTSTERRWLQLFDELAPANGAAPVQSILVEPRGNFSWVPSLPGRPFGVAMVWRVSSTGDELTLSASTFEVIAQLIDGEPAAAQPGGSILINAGVGGSTYLSQAAHLPDLSGDSTYYLTFRITADASYQFGGRCIASIGDYFTPNFYIGCYFETLNFANYNSNVFQHNQYLDDLSWYFLAFITSGNVTTAYVIREGFDPDAPVYLFTGPFDLNLVGPSSSHMIGAFDFNFGIGDFASGYFELGNELLFQGVAHTEAQMLAQFQSRAALTTTGLYSELLFNDETAVGSDQSGNGNDFAEVNADGFQAVPNEPSEWA